MGVVERSNEAESQQHEVALKGLSAYLFAALAACIAVALMACAAFPSNAYADVRKADVIVGETVEDRGLTVAECPSLDAEYAVLVGSDGEVLFERNADSPSQIASITKVMTAIVAIDNVAEGTHVAVSEDAATIGESSAGLQQGDVMDFETALKALLVPSGNDAALALAETIGGQMIAAGKSQEEDSVRAFVNAMNEKAKEIGCTDTVYENPHGLDDGEFAGNLHSTAADQAKVAKCAMGYDLIREIVSGGSVTIKVSRDGGTESIDLETTDGLLDMYDDAIGIKTGVTDLAGPSFMGAANRDGRELYAVVLGSTDEQQRFVDCQSLFEWGFDHVKEVELANTAILANMQQNGENKTVPVIADVSHTDWIDKTVKATMADPEASVLVFDFEGNVSQSVQLNDLTGTVNTGDKVGVIVFKQHNEVVAQQDLIACETVDAPNGIDAIGIAWQRFIGGFSGAPERAESKIYNVMPIISNNKSSAA